MCHGSVAAPLEAEVGIDGIDLDDALTRAQRGEHAAVCAQLRAALVGPALPAPTRLGVLMVLGAAEYYAGDYSGSTETCGRACELAAALGSIGRHAYGLSIRASSLIELGEVGRATEDLLHAELLLARMGDDSLGDPPGALPSGPAGGLRGNPAGQPVDEDSSEDRDRLVGRVRKSLAGSYAELEMFERALVHMQVDTSSSTLIADTINLANLHLRWARHLQRMSRCDEPDAAWRDHLQRAADGLRDAAELIEAGPRTWAALVDKMRKETAAQLDPAAGVEALRAVIDGGVDTGLANTTAVSLAALTTALRRVGRLAESECAGRRALELLGDPRIYAETVTDVLFAVHRTQRERGVPGAETADAYLAAASGELSQLRQERADAFNARLDHELRRQRLADLDDRARHDPLTGLANRRAFDAWLADHPSGPAVLALVDLDNFKSINDSYGHGAGDVVLARFARALAGALTAGATVVRYGGDEFVVVRAGAEKESDRWADRIKAIADGLEIDDVAPGIRLSASVGVRTAAPGESTGSLLGEADAQMYRTKLSCRAAGRCQSAPPPRWPSVPS